MTFESAITISWLAEKCSHADLSHRSLCKLDKFELDVFLKNKICIKVPKREALWG